MSPGDAVIIFTPDSTSYTVISFESPHLNDLQTLTIQLRYMLLNTAFMYWSPSLQRSSSQTILASSLLQRNTTWSVLWNTTNGAVCVT